MHHLDHSVLSRKQKKKNCTTVFTRQRHSTINCTTVVTRHWHMISVMPSCRNKTCTLYQGCVHWTLLNAIITHDPNTTQTWNLHNLTSLYKSRKAQEVRDCKQWLTTLLIVHHTLGILVTNIMDTTQVLTHSFLLILHANAKTIFNCTSISFSFCLLLLLPSWTEVITFGWAFIFLLNRLYAWHKTLELYHFLTILYGRFPP